MIGKQLPIPLQVVFQLRQPLPSQLVAELGRQKPHGVPVAETGTERLPFEGVMQFLVEDGDIARLQAGKVEGLSHARADNRMVPRFIPQRCHRRMGITWTHEVHMDFVAHHNHVMGQANAHQGFQLFGGPHPTHGVVGIAQQEQLDLVFNDRPLESFEVDRVGPVLVHERRIHHLAPIILHHTAEGVIDRLLDQHRIARVGEGPHRSRQGEHDSRGQNEALFRRAPTVTGGKPVIHRIVIGVAFNGVAENTMRNALGKRIGHLAGQGKIHVRHPKRHQIGRAMRGFGGIELEGIGPTAFDGGIEIVMLHG